MWEITYFNRKVFKETLALPMTLKAGFLFLTNKMKENGPHLGMPYTRAMGEGLFEMRVQGQEGIARVFFCTQAGNEIIILHSFIKKTEKTQKNELKIARTRLKEVKKHG